eukprot:GABV01006715.1.p1 GENE.GABV01006715.1~~GABV01006715.1.p1  ORF type:complete len:110 (-),score=18.21 GABV01006715.1:3-332(-)
MMIQAPFNFKISQKCLNGWLRMLKRRGGMLLGVFFVQNWGELCERFCGSRRLNAIVEGVVGVFATGEDVEEKRLFLEKNLPEENQVARARAVRLMEANVFWVGRKILDA